MININPINNQIDFTRNITDRERWGKGVQNKSIGDRVTPERLENLLPIAFYRVENYIDFLPITTPSNPDVNNVRLYHKTAGVSSKLFVLDDTGAETELAAAVPFSSLDDAYNIGSVVSVDTTDLDWRMTVGKDFKITNDLGTTTYFQVNTLGSNFPNNNVSITNNLTIGGSLTVSGASSLSSLSTSADILVGTTLGVSGNTTIAGTLGLTGDLAINTNKFNVTAASGNTTVAGTLGVTSDVAVNTNKFNITAASGNTLIAGTLGVSGVVAASSNVNVTGFINVQPATYEISVAGSITVTGTYCEIETNGGAVVDSLDTINGGSEGDIIILSAINSAHDVNIRDNVSGGGNLQLVLTAGVPTNFLLDDEDDKIMLIKHSDGNWHELTRSDNS